MKALVLACGLAAVASGSDAATYKFSFVSEELQPTAACYDYGDCFAIEPLLINVVVQLPDLISRHFSVQADYEDWFEGLTDIIFSSVPNYPVLAAEDNFLGLGNLGLFVTFRTDELGSLVFVDYHNEDEGDITRATLTLGSFGWPGRPEITHHQAAGAWTVTQISTPLSPVPLPAGGALLLTSVAALLLTRIRRS